MILSSPHCQINHSTKNIPFSARFGSTYTKVGTVQTRLPLRKDDMQIREAFPIFRRYGDICICIADSLCYKAETNTPL